MPTRPSSHGSPRASRPSTGLEHPAQNRCDLVALGWSQDLANAHAAVTRKMLAESPVPVLLTPAHDDLRLRRPGLNPRPTASSMTLRVMPK